MNDITITLPRESAELLLAALKVTEQITKQLLRPALKPTEEPPDGTRLVLRMTLVNIKLARQLIASALGEVPESLT